MNLFRKALYQAARVYWMIFKPLTIGVRVMMLRGDAVLLVRHTYRPNWFFPGGLVERGESLEQAARREAREEVGAELGAADPGRRVQQLRAGEVGSRDRLRVHRVQHHADDQS